MSHKYLLSVVLFTFFIASCCTKKGCLSGEINRIDAYGYTAEELTHLTLFSYEKGSGYTTALDSSYTYEQELENDHYIISGLLMDDRDYKIRVNATGDEFLLDNIATETDKCDINGAFCDYDIEKVTGYRLNGVQTVYDGIAVKLVKP